MKEKRISARAIIIYEDKIVSMYREVKGRKYYTFPGGRIEQNESEQECVKREIFEEFGINVKPIKKVYIYESQNSIEHFYTAEWVSGEFGTGQGEEYQENQPYGIYIPKLIKIADIPSLPLMPPEAAKNFYNDYTKNDKEIRDDIKYIFGEIR